MSGVYYNEFNKYCVAWLKNLIAEGLIPSGDVDERDIRDVRPNDLRGYAQCHFFAGLGGWPLAFRLAGWPDDRSVWSGSAPCQPFSAAGRRAGFDDERHLWPAYFHLIKERRPAKLYGEQVAAASEWLGLVRSDLEAVDYAMGAMPIEAASAGAEHFRDRYWFVANRNDAKRRPNDTARHNYVGTPARRIESASDASERSARIVVDDSSIGSGEGWTEHDFRSRRLSAAVASIDGCQYIECPDGKWRRLPAPGVRWLGTGIPARVDKLRAIGNAIDPRPATAFIRSTIDD